MKLPINPHFAVIQTSKAFIPGDERSKNYPGHGYPERYENAISYTVFNERIQMEDYLKRIPENQEAIGIEVSTVFIRSKEIKVSINAQS